MTTIIIITNCQNLIMIITVIVVDVTIIINIKFKFIITAIIAKFANELKYL